MNVRAQFQHAGVVLGGPVEGAGRWSAAVRLTSADVCVQPAPDAALTLRIKVGGTTAATLTVPASGSAESVLAPTFTVDVPPATLVTLTADAFAGDPATAPAQLAVQLKGAVA